VLPEHQGQWLLDRYAPSSTDTTPGLPQFCLGIRPEHLSLGKPALKNIAALVQRVEPLGQITDVTVQLRPQSQDLELPVVDESLPTWQIRVDSDQSPSVGEAVYLVLNPDRVHFFHRDSGETIVP